MNSNWLENTRSCELCGNVHTQVSTLTMLHLPTIYAVCLYKIGYQEYSFKKLHAWRIWSYEEWRQTASLYIHHLSLTAATAFLRTLRKQPNMSWTSHLQWRREAEASHGLESMADYTVPFGREADFGISAGFQSHSSLSNRRHILPRTTDWGKRRMGLRITTPWGFKCFNKILCN
jgi:hypothetical protein